jgi:peptidoglycan/LPS O-acetylase OafA/YrhL
MFKFRRTCSRKALLGILGFGLVLSFILGMLLLSRSQSMAFYLLPGRAWELLCGSLLALIPPSKIPRTRLWPSLEKAGASLIDVSDLLLDEDGKRYPLHRGDVALYFDTHHLSKEGAKTLAPAFDVIFDN